MSPSVPGRTIAVIAAIILALLVAGGLAVADSMELSRVQAADAENPAAGKEGFREVSMAEASVEDLEQGAITTGPSAEPTVTAVPDSEPTAVAEPEALATADPSATAPVFPSRIRGVWVHVLDDVLLSRASIEEMLDTVVAGGGNTVVVEVARRFDAYYDSAVLARAGDVGFPADLDVLEVVAAGARERGLSVHAWFTAMPAWTPETAKNPEATPNWTFLQHGRDASVEDTWLTFDDTGAPSDFLDPGHPEVQELVVAIAAELAAYDIDAIHLDYLRYPGPESGYNPTSLGIFQAQTGRTDSPAPTDTEWSDWRRAQTTQILQRVNAAVEQVNPSVGISAALIAWGNGPVEGRTFESTPAYSQVYQPWHQWMAGGLLDVAMPMLYFRESRHAHFHRNWMSYVAGLRTSTGVTTAPGQGSWLNSADESILQLAAAAPFVDGAVLFSYQETAAGTGPEGLLGGALRTSVWAEDG